MTTSVRVPTEADVPGIFRCLANYRLHAFGAGDRADPDFPADAILTVRNAISNIDLRRKCWVAEEDGSILGFCCWDWYDEAAASAKTILITVVPEARSTGVGRMLQQRRMDEMREHGAREVHTWSDDPASIRWYREKFGYEVLGHEPIHHSIHRFHYGAREFWGIHRGFVERDRLAHLRAPL